MTEFTATLTLLETTGFASGSSVPVLSIPQRLSSPVVDQSATKTDILAVTDEFIYQEFLLPLDYPRGTAERRIPALSGIQVYVGIADGYAETAALDWRLDHYVSGFGWTPFIDGVSVGAAADGNELWFNLFFDPQEIPLIWDDKWRFGIKGRAATAAPKDVPAPYSEDGGSLIIDDAPFPLSSISNTPLVAGRTYPFDYDGTPAIIKVEPGTNAPFFSVQQGIDSVWYVSPNPLVAQQNSRAYENDGVNPIQDSDQDVSLMFRILAETAEAGRDFLGNNYRGVVHKSSASNIAATAGFDRWWMSKPNPSRFAVESLYFDVRSKSSPAVIDRVLTDPITPDVYFNLYYSLDENPGVDERSWDNFLWHPVPKSFKMTAREIQALPRPIAANFVKMEFTRLQGRHYNPGIFQRPMVYKRFPRWVFDYYENIYQWVQSNQEIIADSVTVSFDALDLAFNYYLGDLHQSPDQLNSVALTETVKVVNTFLQTSGKSGIDATTLSKIIIDFRPYLNAPFANARPGSLLADYGSDNINTGGYSTEQNIVPSFDPGGEVGSADPAPLIDELNRPPMRFPLTCRHLYQYVSAAFAYNVGYFAGLRTVAFLRAANVQPGQIHHDILADNKGVARTDLAMVTDGTESFLAVEQ